MDEIEAAGTDWRKILYRWLGFIPFDHLKGWLDGVKPARLPAGTVRGRYLDEVTRVLAQPAKDHKKALRQLRRAQSKPAVAAA